MDLYTELLQLVDALERENIPYALCGGIALALHGHPRFTRDIDILVQSEDLEKLRETARQSGFRAESGKIPFEPGGPRARELWRMLKIEGHETLTLDLMVVTPILENAWTSRGAFEWKGRRISAVSREGLTEMKRLAGRKQDIADLEKLGFDE